MKKVLFILSLLTLVPLVSSCSEPNSNAIFDPDTGTHVGNWIVDHRAQFLSNPGQCLECHGNDLRGGISGVSCFSVSFEGLSCHPNGPSGHPSGWAAPKSHGASAKEAPDPTAQKGFSTCQSCHGDDFDGGISNASCFQSLCHDTVVQAPHGDPPWRTSGGTALTHTDTDELNAPVCADCHRNDPLNQNPAPPGTPAGCFNNTLCHGSARPTSHNDPNFTQPSVHGTDAKSAPDQATTKGFSVCQSCHGSGFDGGNALVSCFQALCHDTVVQAPHGDAPWRTNGGTTLTHTDTNELNAPVCADCHRNDPLNQNPAPPGTPAGCFNNTLCHGTDAAGHVLPFADPALHGPPAKSDLTVCQQCHADNPTGGAGSNPRFNVALGSLTVGCEDCHNDFTAHPSDTSPPGRESVGWFGDPWQHTDVGQRTTACALCHVVDPASGGTVGPDCRVCHTLREPLSPDDCSSCHGNPPSGAASPDTQAAHDEHDALTVITGVCGTCHTNAGNRTANHFNQATEVSISATYDAQSGAASYDSATAVCADVACHGGQNSFAWTGANSYDMSFNTTCLLCHEDGTNLPATNQFNSQSSGEHRKHANQGISCIECHDMVGQNALHFNGLDNKNDLGADAVQTLNLIDLVNGGTINVSSTNPVTCTGTCHNQGHNNEGW